MGLRCSLLNCIGLALAFGIAGFGADACAVSDLYSPYGFQLRGTTTISGPETPVVGVGRVTFDGQGNTSGTSSVNFNGLFLGNPVTGKYEIKTDCTLTFSLQDTSGAFQHFTGTMRPGGNRIDFSQSDAGTNVRGVMERTTDGCDAATFHGAYSFAMNSVNATAEADGSGSLTLTRAAAKTDGTYTVDSDCFVELDLALPGAVALIKLRGILVDDGAALLAIQTDPEQVSAATLIRAVKPTQPVAPNPLPGHKP